LVEYLDFGDNKAKPTPNPSQEGNRRQEAPREERRKGIITVYRNLISEGS